MFSYELNKLFLDISRSGYLPAKGLIPTSNRVLQVFMLALWINNVTLFFILLFKLFMLKFFFKTHLFIFQHLLYILHWIPVWLSSGQLQSINVLICFIFLALAVHYEFFSYYPCRFTTSLYINADFSAFDFFHYFVCNFQNYTPYGDSMCKSLHILPFFKHDVLFVICIFVK